MIQPPNSPLKSPQPAAAGDQAMRRMELVISNLLRVGVAISLLLIIVGTVVSFVRHPAYLSSHDDLPPLIDRGPSSQLSLDVEAGLGARRGQAIVALGLLVLIATPMMRVAVSVVAFLLEGDRLYTLITLGVFCLLVLSLALGAVE